MIEIKLAEASDREWVKETLVREWDGPLIERADEFVDASELPAIIATLRGSYVGLATILYGSHDIEIMTINGFSKGKGVGTKLLAWVEEDARKRGLNRIKIFTSNDNLDALRFYQRRGFRIEAIWKDSISKAREVKKGIPMEGDYGIPVCDEIELVKVV